jgi:hypothetical protein
MTLLIARSHDYAASSHSRCLLVSALTNEEEIDTHGPRMLTAELGPTGSQHAKSRLPRHRASFEAQSGTMYLHITVILRAETWIVRRETQRSTEFMMLMTGPIVSPDLRLSEHTKKSIEPNCRDADFETP